MHTLRFGNIDLDEQRLAKDLSSAAEFEYSYAYSNYICGGPWRSCMLWSVGGDTGSGLVTEYDHDRASSKTPCADEVPYLMEVIEHTFDLTHLNFVRLALLSPGSVIIPHKDLLELNRISDPQRNAHRVHVPLRTDADCYFTQDNIVYRMKAGEIWFFDSSTEHSAACFSGTDRLHLMLDFTDVEDPLALIKSSPSSPESDGIPPEAVIPRPKLTDIERETLLSLANIVDIHNYRDILGLVIKTHYRKDGGPDFIWDTMLKIGARSGDKAADAKIHELHEYFVISRPL